MAESFCRICSFKRVVLWLCVTVLGLFIFLLYPQTNSTPTMSLGFYSNEASKAPQNLISVALETEKNLVEATSQPIDPEEKMTRRKELINEVCRSPTGVNKEYNIHRSPHWAAFFVDTKKKFSYCAVFKAGSSTMFDHLVRAGGILGPEQATRLYKSEAVRRITLVRKCYPVYLNKLNSYYNFLSVRHPLERLLSAFRDKLEYGNKKWYYDKYGKNIWRRYGGKNGEKQIAVDTKYRWKNTLEKVYETLNRDQQPVDVPKDEEKEFAENSATNGKRDEVFDTAPEGRLTKSSAEAVIEEASTALRSLEVEREGAIGMSPPEWVEVLKTHFNNKTKGPQEVETLADLIEEAKKDIFIDKPDLAYKLPPLEETPTFEQFVRYVLDNKNYDEHWRPIYQQCSPCDIHFDAILKLESFNEDQDYVLRKLHLRDTLTPTAVNQNKQKTEVMLRKYYSSITMAQLKGLINIYKPDIEMFGYNIDAFYDMVRR